MSPLRWLLIALFVLTGRAAQDPLMGLQEKWRHYQSPNFELYSSEPEKDSRLLLWNLEIVRAVFLAELHVVERSPLPVTIYQFRKLDHFWFYGPPGVNRNSNVRAFYLPNPDRAIVAMGPTNTPEDSRHLVFHEYIHHMFRSADQTPTLWFNEGAAEMLATLKVVKNTVQIGHATPGVLNVLVNQPLLPLQTLFNVRATDPIYLGHKGQDMFYAESWALLHYLHFGENKLPGDGISRFVRVMGDARLAREINPRDLFRECFGIDYAQMQQRLDRYVVNGKYHYGVRPIPAIPAASTYPGRSVPLDEARLRLAELALRVNQLPAAKLILLDAAESSRDPRINETLGTAALLYDQNPTGGLQRWEKAAALGSANPALDRELGALETLQWLQPFNYDLRLPPEIVARLRQRFLRSIRAVPAQSASYELLALVEAFSAEPAIENVNLVQEHFKQLKEKPRTLVALALVRARLNRIDEAKSVLSELSFLEPEPAIASIVDIIRARLDAAGPPGGAAVVATP